MTWPAWDPLAKGNDVTLSGGDLVASVLAWQEWARCTLGRDPADGGVWQWEVTVPLTGGSGQGDRLRPVGGMVTQNRAITSTVGSGAGWYGDLDAWVAGFGTAGIENDYKNHNGPLGNWTGGSHGGEPHVLGYVWDALAATLALYIDGVLKDTLTGVTGGSGILMYPMFGSGSNYAFGVQDMLEVGTANFGATALAYPVVGAAAWGDAPAVGSGAGFFALI